MSPRGYVPDTGEVVWLEFDLQAGHETSPLENLVGPWVIPRQVSSGLK